MDSNNKDLSLFDFILLCAKKTKAFFVWLGRLLHITIVVALKHWYFVVICTIIGALFAWFWSKPQFSRFTGEATIIFPVGMKNNIKEGINCFLTESPENKSDKYGIPYSVQKRFKRLALFNCIDAKRDGQIDYVDYDDDVPYTDTLNIIAQDRMQIQIKMIGCDGFDIYEKALALYFNQNEEYAEPAARWRESRKRMIDEISYEVNRTDSFINHDYFHVNHRYLILDSFSMARQNQLHYEDINELRNMREYMVEQLSRTPDVINFQTHLHYYTMLPRNKYIISILLGLFIGIIASFIVEYRQNILSYMHTA